MKNVFLDTNILIDYVLNRPGGNDAEQLLISVAIGLNRGKYI